MKHRALYAILLLIFSILLFSCDDGGTVPEKTGGNIEGIYYGSGYFELRSSIIGSDIHYEFVESSTVSITDSSPVYKGGLVKAPVGAVGVIASQKEPSKGFSEPFHLEFREPRKISAPLSSGYFGSENEMFITLTASKNAEIRYSFSKEPEEVAYYTTEQNTIYNGQGSISYSNTSIMDIGGVLNARAYMGTEAISNTAHFTLALIVERPEGRAYTAETGERMMSLTSSQGARIAYMIIDSPDESQFQSESDGTPYNGPFETKESLMGKWIIARAFKDGYEMSLPYFRQITDGKTAEAPFYEFLYPAEAIQKGGTRFFRLWLSEPMPGSEIWYRIDENPKCEDFERNSEGTYLYNSEVSFASAQFGMYVHARAFEERKEASDVVSFMLFPFGQVFAEDIRIGYSGENFDKAFYIWAEGFPDCELKWKYTDDPGDVMSSIVPTDRILYGPDRAGQNITVWAKASEYGDCTTEFTLEMLGTLPEPEIEIIPNGDASRKKAFRLYTVDPYLDATIEFRLKDNTTGTFTGNSDPYPYTAKQADDKTLIAVSKLKGFNDSPEKTYELETFGKTENPTIGLETAKPTGINTKVKVTLNSATPESETAIQYTTSMVSGEAGFKNTKTYSSPFTYTAQFAGQGYALAQAKRVGYDPSDIVSFALPYFGTAGVPSVYRTSNSSPPNTSGSLAITVDSASYPGERVYYMMSNSATPPRKDQFKTSTTTAMSLGYDVSDIGRYYVYAYATCPGFEDSAVRKMSLPNVGSVPTPHVEVWGAGDASGGKAGDLGKHWGRNFAWNIQCGGDEGYFNGWTYCTMLIYTDWDFYTYDYYVSYQFDGRETKSLGYISENSEFWTSSDSRFAGWRFLPTEGFDLGKRGAITVWLTISRYGYDSQTVQISANPPHKNGW